MEINGRYGKITAGRYLMTTIVSKLDMQRAFSRKAKHSSHIQIPKGSAYPKRMKEGVSSCTEAPELHRTYPVQVRSILKRATQNQHDDVELCLLRDEILSLGKCRGGKIVLSYINKLLLENGI
jgi:hypothetical protein